MVDYWDTDIQLNPQCSHGPTLLFSRKGNDRKFYACSAFRDRKQCPFFVWQDEADKRLPAATSDSSFSQLVSKFTSYRKKVHSLSETFVKKSYCCTCELLISAKKCQKHVGHDVKEIVDDSALRYPTLVMKPKQQSQGESQFHFSESTIQTIHNFLVKLNISAVLSVGCPSIHEFISNNDGTRQLESLLLDIDPRFLQFYEPSQFQLFNMFNCHMFDPEAWDRVRALFSSGKTCIIIDPPFGGRVEPLAYTLKRLQNINRSIPNAVDLTVMIVLPYFMEPAVKQSLPSFSMLDYQVEYVNHRQFRKRSDNLSNRGSAVRIFTNASLSLFVLPEEEGYKYCDLCERWVCRENKHCFKCESCTSKNGAPYRHCNRCGKCVKQTWKHCFECGICKLMEHVCQRDYPVQTGKVKLSGNGFKKRKLGRK